MRANFDRLFGKVILRVLVCTSCVALSSAHAQAPIKTWKATEVWRTDGGENGDPFSDLRDYVVLKDNSLWALDFKAQNIRRYDAAGKLLGNIARKGQGPGEIANANGMLVVGDNTVWVNDPANARFSVFTPDGKFAHQYLLPSGGFGYRWMSWQDKASGDVVEQRIGQPRGWRRIDKTGKDVGTIPTTDCPDGSPSVGYIKAQTPGGMTGSYPFSSGGGVAPDGNGNAWCAAPRSKTVVLIHVGKNDTVTKAALEYPAIPVTSAERSDAIAATEKMLAKYATNDFDKSKVASAKPGITALSVDYDGRLWVQHGVAFGQKSTTLDVFDPKGKHLGRVVVPVKQSTYMPVRARGNLMWLTVLDDDDVPHIVQFKLQP